MGPLQNDALGSSGLLHASGHLGWHRKVLMRLEDAHYCSVSTLEDSSIISQASSLVLGIQNKMLTVDLPHELRAKFDRLFEFLFSLAV
jgi:hypothetical protein